MRKLFVIFLLTLIAETLPAQLLHFHQLTVKDGLPHNSIIALGQDKQGDLWLATSNGMCRYDGEKFEMISTKSLPNKRVDRINCAKDGSIWVQCYEQHDKVSRYDTLTRQFITYDTLSLADSIRKQVVLPLNRTFKDSNSERTWTVKKRNLVEGNVAYTGQMAVDAGLMDETIFSLLLDQQGILWAGSANNGLFFADTRQQHYKRLVSDTNPLVRAVCKDSGGTLWIADSKDLYALPEGHKEYEAVSYPLKDSIEGRRIRPIIEDSKKQLWIGAFDGLYLRQDINNRTFQRIEFPDTLTHSVYALAEDDKQRLWIGTEKGLYRINPDGKMLPQLIDSTLVHIINIFPGKDHCWIASEKGLFRKTNDKLEQWSDIEAHCVLTDATGQTWVGTDNGLCRIAGRELQPFASPADGHIVKGMLYWHDFLWCSYDQGICCINIYTGKSTKLHTQYNEYSEGDVFLDAQTGTLYFGGTQGIDCFVADSLEPQLRSGMSHLWLEEMTEEVTLKDDSMPLTAWWQWAIAVVIFCGIACTIAVVILRKRGYKGISEKSEDIYLPTEAIDETSETQEEVAPAVSPFMAKATAYVNAHLADTELTAEQIAREMAMSRSKLFELMKQETGKGVMEFVRDLRLEYAANRLEAGDSVAEITYACGFSDPSSFRRAFTNKYGVTPSQYRTKNR